jgi:hypothetical protein
VSSDHGIRSVHSEKKGGSGVIDQKSSEAPRGKKLILAISGLDTWVRSITSVIGHFGEIGE